MIPVTAIHQIEITSRCNLRCVYCPSPGIMGGKYPNRPAVDMSRETFEKAVALAEVFVRRGTQNELNLAGIGESTLHPEFADFVRHARERLGRLTKLIFATNGIIHDEGMIAAIAPYRPVVYVSLHRPEKAGPAIELYKKYGLLGGVSADPSISANDWAGQVAWHNSGDKLSCQWINKGRVMVMADGRITRCCLDASGAGVLGHVETYTQLTEGTSPYDLCKTCYQVIDDPKWDQQKGAPR